MAKQVFWKRNKNGKLVRNYFSQVKYNVITQLIKFFTFLYQLKNGKSKTKVKTSKLKKEVQLFILKSGNKKYGN
jgi:hypothetical protein